MPPIRYGITADTGGHIAYVLEAARAQAGLPQVDSVSVVTRLFEDEHLGADYARASERLGAKATIDRIATANRRYLEKEDLSRDLPAFADALCAHLIGRPRRPDVLHAHFADAAQVAEVVRRRLGIPFVYTPHALGMDKRGMAADDPRLDQRIAAERGALAEADAVIVSTRNEADRQVAAYQVPGLENRLWQISPGVPQLGMGLRSHRSGGPAPWQPTPWDRSLDDAAKPIILAIARPIRKKNLVGLVRAFAANDELRRRTNLVILAGQHEGGVPSDEQRAVVAELRRWAATPALRGRFALPDRHDTADAAALYRRAAAGGVFVNPALHEPFGLTLIEAAAAGVPVVATGRGGPADIIATTGHGLLVDPLDEPAIGAACLRVVSDPALHRRLSRAGLDNAHWFSWSRYADRSVALYATLGRAARPALPARPVPERAVA
ncbi:MAG: glycosyltransferase [Janthinobacterium lividum]